MGVARVGRLSNWGELTNNNGLEFCTSGPSTYFQPHTIGPSFESTPIEVDQIDDILVQTRLKNETGYLQIWVSSDPNKHTFPVFYYSNF